MTKKQNKTFAERANKIIKSYSRADFDPIEKAALESSLDKLQQEQEAYKQANGIDRVNPEQQGGNNIFPGDNGSSYLPVDNFYTQDYGYTPESSRSAYTPASEGFRVVGAPGYTPPIEEVVTPEVIAPESTITPNKTKVQRESVYLPNTPMQRKSGIIPSTIAETNLAEQKHYPNVADVDSLASNFKQKESSYSPYKTSITPSLISGAASTIGNLYLANQQKGNTDLKLPRISTPKISLERGRQAAQREGTRAKQRIKYAAKAGARTRGEYMANRIAGESTVSGKVGETLSASHEKEALVNANMEAGMNKANAEIAAKEEMINHAQTIKNKKEREAYLAAAMSSVGKTSANINALKQKDAYINMMGDDYGMYMYDDPNRRFWQSKEKVKAFRNKETGKVTRR